MPHRFAHRKIMKGVYILVMSLADKSHMKIGSLGAFDFKKGYYAYTGSAMGGLEQRVGRHLRKDKKLHWHIDYFLRKAGIVACYMRETDSKHEECMAAGSFQSAGGEAVPDFGCGDCKCNSHLYYFKNRSSIKTINYRLVNI